MGWIMDLIQGALVSPIGLSIQGMLGAADLDQRQQAAIAENRELFEEIQGLRRSNISRGQDLFGQQGAFLQNMRGSLMADQGGRNATLLREMTEFRRTSLQDFDTGAGEINQGMLDRETGILRRFDTGSEDVLNRFDQSSAGVMDTLNSRLERGLASLEGAGEQERQDINTNFDISESNQRAQLQRTGFSGGSIGASLSLGVERERSGSLGRLGERLRGERSALDERLSGDIATAQSVLGSERAGLQTGFIGARAGMAESLSGDRLGTELGLFNARLDFNNSLSGNIFDFQERSGNQMGALDAATNNAIFQNMAQGNAFTLSQNDDFNAFMERTSIPIPGMTPQMADLQQRMGMAAGFQSPDRPGFWDQYGGSITQGGLGIIAALLI